MAQRLSMRRFVVLTEPAAFSSLHIIFLFAPNEKTGIRNLGYSLKTMVASETDNSES